MDRSQSIIMEKNDLKPIIICGNCQKHNRKEETEKPMNMLQLAPGLNVNDQNWMILMLCFSRLLPLWCMRLSKVKIISIFFGVDDPLSRKFFLFLRIRWVQSNHTYTKQLIPKCFRSRKVNLNNKNDQKPMHRSHSLKHDKRKEQKKSWKKNPFYNIIKCERLHFKTVLHEMPVMNSSFFLI